MILHYKLVLALNFVTNQGKLKPQIGSILALFLVLLLAACGDSSSTPVPATKSTGSATAATSATDAVKGELKVFAATSLTDPFNEIKLEFEKENPGTTVTYNFGGSSDLRTQLEQGAKADVFASADPSQMSKAQTSGLVDDVGLTFVRNRLVVILPRSNPAKIEKLQDLAKSGIKFVTADKGVAIGAYTLTALDKMSKDNTFGSDFSSKVQANFVSQESSVKQIVSKIQAGEADAAIVYLSDVPVKIKADFISLDIPDQFNVIASYPVNTLKASSSAPTAKTFMNYLFGVKAQAILKKYNFVPVINTTL